MDIKLIAMDLDGTLLNKKKELTERTRRALEQAAAKGVHIVPSTGRTFGGVPQEIRELPFVRYGICVNGASVWDAQADDALYKAEIPYARAQEIFDFVEKYHTMYDCYIDGWGRISQAFYDRREYWLQDEQVVKLVTATRQPVPDLREYVRALGHDVQKIILFFRDMELRAQAMREIAETMPDLWNNVELNRKGADKGAALRFLCSHLGFGLENAMACGDGGNDSAMIEAAGLGVVMENGTEELKKQADYITLSNEEDGVAAAIEKFVLCG